MLSLCPFLFAATCAAEEATAFDFVQAFLQYPDRMIHQSQEDPRTERLLEQFKPRVLVSPVSYVPLDFYADYLSRCVVRKRGWRRRIVHRHVDRDLLRDIQHDGALYLDFLPSPREMLKPSSEAVHPTVYGRVYRDTFSVNDVVKKLVFLKYSLAFPYSGLPEELSWWKKLGSKLIGDPSGWHELDIHGAIHIVLDGKDERPIGVLLAQHNHHRVFLCDRDFKWPEDNRVLIAFSELSNEPYLIGDASVDVRYEPTIGNPMDMAFLFGRTDRAPLGGGYDRIVTPKGGAREIETVLKLLPLDDPLYTASISLGDRKRFLGLVESWYIAGPPGIDYYTFPELKNLADLMAFWSIDPRDDVFFNLLQNHFHSFSDYDLMPILTHQKARLHQALSISGH